MTLALTWRQSRALRFIESFKSARGTSPSIRDLADGLGISAPTALNHVRALERKGRVIRTPGQARSLRIVEGAGHGDDNPVKVPILGSISAGRPLQEEQQAGEHLSIDPRLASGQALFALRVSGDSMDGAGILDGDYVLARFQRKAQDGEIVVARIGSEMTVKRLAIRKNSQALVAANSKYRDIPFEGEDAEIQGKVVGVVGRRL